jgi:hypothetical protein
LTIPVAEAEPLDSYHSSWHLVRETADEDGADFETVYNLDASEGHWAGKDGNSVADGGPFQIRSTDTEMRPPSEGMSPGAVWEFVICGGLAENDTFSFDIVGWSKTNGMLQVIAVCDGVIGTQDVVIYPDSGAATNIWWADTINLDTVSPVRWPGVSVRNSGNNEVCMILVDTTGLEWIQFVMYDCDGSGTEASNLTVYGRRY